MPSALYIAVPKAQKKGYVFQRNPLFCWSERHDSNMRHPAPKAGALPSCATLRPCALLALPLAQKSIYPNVLKHASKKLPKSEKK